MKCQIEEHFPLFNCSDIEKVWNIMCNVLEDNDSSDDSDHSFGKLAPLLLHIDFESDNDL